MSPPSPSAAAARREAAAILHESRFRGGATSRPVRGVLATIGDALSSVSRAIDRAIAHLGVHLPGGAAFVWVIVGLLLAAIVAIIARLVAERRLRRRAASALDGVAALEPPPDAARLTALAEAAERDHDHDRALRLRFRAGLQGLAESDRVRAPGSRPSRALARELASQDFDALAERFDEVAYGGDAAHEEDVSDARRRWPLVLSERRSR